MKIRPVIAVLATFVVAGVGVSAVLHFQEKGASSTTVASGRTAGLYGASLTANSGTPVAAAGVNQQATQTAIQDTFPSAAGSGVALLGRSAAESEARAGAKTPGAPAAEASAVTFSRLTTYAIAEGLTGGGNSSVAPTTPVWIVTVHAPTMTDGSPAIAPKRVDQYSVILDAVNGQGIDTCIGCAWITSSS